MKLVINKCYGGFSISEAAIKKYAELSGKNLYPSGEGWGITYWTVPPDNPDRIRAEHIQENFQERALEKLKWSNKFYTDNTISNRAFSRDDPILIKVVEALGEEADGDHAELTIVDIPEGVEWVIEEYDGSEWVAEKHRTWRGGGRE